MEVSKNFILQEFMPKDIYSKYKNRCIWFIDPSIITIAQMIRSRFAKPMIINNWHTRKEGGFQFRGFRDPLCTIGAALSQHRFGRGLDFNVIGISSEEIYKDIIDNEFDYMAYGVTTVESIEHTPNWIHVDIRQQNKDQIVVVEP